MKKNMVSKLLALTLAATMMAACGTSGTETSPKETAAKEETSAPAGKESGTAPAESGGEAEARQIVYAYCDAEGSMIDMTAKKFKEILEEKSEGRFQVRLYPNGSLGNTSELASGLIDGTITMISGDMTPVYYAPYGVFEMQRLFDSRENAKKAVEKGGEFRTALEKVSEEGNIKLLSCVPAAYRVLSSNKKVEKVEDIEGLKLRLMESDIPMAFWGALKASPTPISIGEVYIALQQGLVEAQENPLSVMIGYNLQEQQKYIVETNHKLFFCEQLMNLEFFNSLSAEDQQLILDVCEEVDAFTYQNAADMEADSVEFLKGQGLEFITPSEEFYAKLDAVAAESYDIVRASVGDELVDLALKAVGK
ncbi:TRAP transporter substrate-binding protein [Hominifimenecus sp. rT4P-3]|uniref:TRAP transporter substrate-binding protein n=1 Tax=Hominifimenecus sp. rT4P-3 TaxID=3242979 RepID=UPI003DA4259F